ncbi:hypothetical protein [Halobaculum sp. EA56]|uniref:hypothetical protein n=1 Tax=Halobaculum sp. EA56 TaxID=3421648 RepID=UPI003EB8DABD
MDALDTLRRPEYTGERRCWPCTAVNAAAVLLASAVAAAVSGPVALLVLCGGAALIYLRGYVVPGTPEFAPRLVAALGLAPYFDHVAPDGGRADDSRRESDDLADHPEPERLLGAMFEAGVLEEGDDGALYLTDEFEAAWREELAALRDGSVDDLVAATAEAVPFEATGERRYDGVSVEGEGGVVWLRPVNATGDVAAVRAMARLGVPESVRAPGAAPLRLFTPECPNCGGDLAERTVQDACCGGTMGYRDTPTRDVLACVDCDAEVHEFDDPAAGGDAGGDEDGRNDADAGSDGG